MCEANGKDVPSAGFKQQDDLLKTEAGGVLDKRNPILPLGVCSTKMNMINLSPAKYGGREAIVMSVISLM